jgi:hypothetical protein
MLRKDLILRQFEEFGKVFALILSFKKNQDWDNFEKEAREAMRTFTQLDISVVEQLPPEKFMNEIVEPPTLSFEKKKIVAQLLFEKMDYYGTACQYDKYTELKNKCIAIYQHLAGNLTENEYDMDVHYKLEFLKKLGD